MKIQSITINVPVSQVKNFEDIVSKYNWDIVSITDFNPISIAENTPGSEIIDELEGVFSSCVIDEDWKCTKQEVLTQEYCK